MSDALGGVVNVGMVVFFIIIISLYMAYNVNYEKAFNVKNEIVSRYEEYGGICNAKCNEKIEDFEAKIGYTKLKLNETSKDEHCTNTYGYCVTGYPAKANSFSKSIKTKKKYCYFNIRTQILIDIPIINNFLDLPLFRVTGQTKSMEILSDQTCDQLAEQGAKK